MSMAAATHPAAVQQLLQQLLAAAYLCARLSHQAATVAGVRLVLQQLQLAAAVRAAAVLLLLAHKASGLLHTAQQAAS
jgi:heptaprenylglyceryl phosphate synthase